MLERANIPSLLSALLFLLCSHAIQAEEAPVEPSNTAPITPEAIEKDTRKATVVTAQYQQQALSDEQRLDEIVWLEPTYPNMDKPARVLALVQKPRTPQAQGAVLIVPDHGQHPDWPALVSPLRRNLPDHGWYTLSLAMPHPSSGIIPERELETKMLESVSLNGQIESALQQGARTQAPVEKPADTEASQPSAEPEAALGTETVSDPVDIDLQDKQGSAESRGSYSAWSQANLQAGMSHLQGLGYQNVVLVVIGRSAEQALAWLKPNAQQFSRGGFALVLIAPTFTQSGQGFWSDRLGAGFAAPVLDIVNSADLTRRAEAELRRADAEVAGMRGYQQMRLMTSGDGLAQKSLLRRVQQWMNTYAPGMTATQFQRKGR